MAVVTVLVICSVFLLASAQTNTSETCITENTLIDKFDKLELFYRALVEKVMNISEKLDNEVKTLREQVSAIAQDCKDARMKLDQVDGKLDSVMTALHARFDMQDSTMATCCTMQSQNYTDPGLRNVTMTSNINETSDGIKQTLEIGFETMLVFAHHHGQALANLEMRQSSMVDSMANHTQIVSTVAVDVATLKEMSINQSQSLDKIVEKVATLQRDRSQGLSNETTCINNDVKEDLNDVKQLLIKPCPEGYLQNAYGCYKFGVVPVTAKVAKQQCKGQLATVTSVGEQLALQDLMVKNNISLGIDYWLAGERKNGKWLYGSLPLKYENWEKGSFL